jgi:membrane-bound lytic murein transglycosylase D
LPAELALVPGIESSYDPLAKNPTDAYAGMWQFVPMTGQRFNMAQNDNIDERRDIVKSTRAALDYFNYLHLMFKQWDVAIGAYNWGEGGMYRAILNSGMTLGNVTYSDLQLRQITADYVPKIIALASIIENPDKFGVTLPSVANEPYFALVAPANNTSVSDVSRLSSVDSTVFTKLNPQYKKTSYPLTVNSNLLLPIANQTIYYANIGQVMVIANGLELANNTQAATSGDNNIQPAALVTTEDAGGVTSMAANPSDAASATANAQNLDDLVNQLDSQNSGSPAISDNLAVADADTAVVTKVSLATAEKTVKYKVSPGDTLYSISKKFNANINQIRNDNHIPGNNLSAGQVLNIKSNSVTQTSTM